MAVVQLESGQAAIKVVQKLDSHVVQGCTVRVRTNDKVVPFHIGQRKCRLIVRNLAFKVCCCVVRQHCLRTVLTSCLRL